MKDNEVEWLIWQAVLTGQQRLHHDIVHLLKHWNGATVEAQCLGQVFVVLQNVDFDKLTYCGPQDAGVPTLQSMKAWSCFGLSTRVSPSDCEVFDLRRSQVPDIRNGMG